jgi:hypothetical protein
MIFNLGQKNNYNYRTTKQLLQYKHPNETINLKTLIFIVFC